MKLFACNVLACPRTTRRLDKLCSFYAEASRAAIGQSSVDVLVEVRVVGPARRRNSASLQRDLIKYRINVLQWQFDKRCFCSRSWTCNVLLRRKELRIA